MMQEKEKLTGEELRTQNDDKYIYRFSSRIWIPNIVELKNEILHEAHSSIYLIRPGST